MKPTYERISWGWLAYVLHAGYLYTGRGGTKAEARRALKKELA
jgi:hypothetical protein